MYQLFLGVFWWIFCSARSLTTPGGRRRTAMYEEDDDLTKDMDDPTPEPNIQEVSLQRVVNVKSHRDADSQPIRGGTLLDIDEESEVSGIWHSNLLLDCIVLSWYKTSVSEGLPSWLSDTVCCLGSSTHGTTLVSYPSLQSSHTICMDYACISRFISRAGTEGLSMSYLWLVSVIMPPSPRWGH